MPRKKKLSDDRDDLPFMSAATEDDERSCARGTGHPSENIVVEFELDAKLPLLDQLTQLTHGKDPALDAKNRLDSLVHFDSYRALESLLLDLTAELGVGQECIRVHEGYMAEAFSRRFGICPHDEDSFKFRNAIFDIAGEEPEKVLKAAEIVAERPEHCDVVMLLRLDARSGLILAKLHEWKRKKGPVHPQLQVEIVGTEEVKTDDPQ
jgi:hypothetical protein